MLTETISGAEILRQLNLPENIETVDYPPEVIDRWRKELDITNAKIAAGEDMSLETWAAELGIDLDDNDDAD